MGARIRGHIRANVVGYIALFFALSGTAYATHESILSIDIVDGEVKNVDLGADAVTGDKVSPSTLTGSDVATSSLGGSDIAFDTLSHLDIGANAVGTSELGQLPVARAFATSAQSVATTSAPTLNLTTENFDTGGLYTAPNDHITINVPGTYLLSGDVGFNPDPDGVRGARIQVDGSTVAVNQAAGSTGSSVTRTPVSTIARLSGGDQVTLQILHSAGNSLSTAAYGGTALSHGYLAVQYLSD